MRMSSVNAKHTEHEMRGAKTVNNRNQTESEGKDNGTDKREWSEIYNDWRLCVCQMEKESTAPI